MSKGSIFTVAHGDVGVTGRCRRILVNGLGSIGSECCRFWARLGLEGVGILAGDTLFSLDSVIPLGTTS